MIQNLLHIILNLRIDEKWKKVFNIYVMCFFFCVNCNHKQLIQKKELYNNEKLLFNPSFDDFIKAFKEMQLQDNSPIGKPNNELDTCIFKIKYTRFKSESAEYFKGLYYTHKNDRFPTFFISNLSGDKFLRMDFKETMFERKINPIRINTNKILNLPIDSLFFSMKFYSNFRESIITFKEMKGKLSENTNRIHFEKYETSAKEQFVCRFKSDFYKQKCLILKESLLEVNIDRLFKELTTISEMTCNRANIKVHMGRQFFESPTPCTKSP